MFNLFFQRTIFVKIAGFVGSPLPSGNNVGNAIVAKYGLTYSFNGRSVYLSQGRIVTNEINFLLVGVIYR